MGFGSARLSIRLVALVVAIEVVVLDSLPNAVVIDVANDLASVDTGDELHRLVTLGTSGGAARLYSADDCSALSDGRGVAHVI